MTDSINIKIGGKAGEGIKTTGLILAKSLSRLGFSLFAYDEYPSLVRGGHNTYQVYASVEKVYSQHQDIDLLIAFDEQSWEFHQKELKNQALVLFDPDIFEPEKALDVRLVAIPWKKIAQESAGSAIAANMVAIGAALSLLGLPLKTLEGVVGDVFAAKGKDVLEGNYKAVQAGAIFIQEHFSHLSVPLQLPSKSEEQIVVLGNEAIGSGAIAAGLKYFTSYPMTPVSSLLHFLAAVAEDFNIVVDHAENEIASINTLLGASVAGVRAMTTTSGGGFSLMVEGMGMAGIAEIPAVIVLGMRPGPATGLPTWTGQGDLRFAIHASQDEFPRVVLTPGNAFEAFEMTKKAFTLAEKYQLPAIVLVDKYLCESHQSGPVFPLHHQNARLSFTPEIKGDFFRYSLTDSGISPRPILGQKGGASLIANSYEHSLDGLATEEGSDREKQMEKRWKKMTQMEKELGELPLFGPEKAKVTLVGFGSTLGPALEALKDLPEVNYLHFNYVWPYPDSATKILSQAKQVICLEGNAQGQLQGLIREFSSIETADSLRKFNGRPFYPEEIVQFVRGLQK